jgi:hypothetical protein
MARTGMRIGEALALQWDDVDFAQHEIRVARAVSNSPDSLGHTFASLLPQQGESPAYVLRQLGHASIKLTVDTYGRWLPMGNKAAVDRLDEGFVTPDGAAGSRLAATATPRRGRRSQVVERMVRPAGVEPATYRFVARNEGSSDHHQEEPGATKDEDSGHEDSGK